MNDGKTQYLYGSLGNPFQVTASRAPDNVLTVYYYDDYNALYALERGSARYYVGSDHLGTPKVITDNTGAIMRQMEYDSWGVKISDIGDTSFDLPVGFAGGIPDDATGLVRFGLRDYEPATGRWAAKDPIFFRGGLNLYVYLGNSPINRKDPSGLIPGDLFNSLYSAAKDALNYIVYRSFTQVAEYAGFIYKTSNGQYTYNEPQTQGNPVGVTFISDPSVGEIAGMYHTHPFAGGIDSLDGTGGVNYDPEVISGFDKKQADKNGYPSFIGTLGGQILSYYPPQRTCP